MSERPSIWDILAALESDHEEALLIQAAEEAEEGQAFLEAVEMTERQFLPPLEQQQQGGGAVTTEEDEAGPSDAGGRFQFDLEPVVDRRSIAMGVRERVFRTRVHQRGRFGARQRLDHALVQGLDTALGQLLNQENIADRDRVYFTIASNRLNNAYHGWGLTAQEWRQGGARVDALLNNLSKMLNSNEQFEMDDSFNLSFVHVRGPPYGGGKKQRVLLPGHVSSTRLRQDKKTVILIPQTDDNLCCARAIVTAKARADNHPQWRAFQRHRKIQQWSALELHQQAAVPPGKCGPPELRQFAAILPDYKIIVVDASRNYHCFVYGEGEKQLGLLYDEGHYDALTSLPGFFGRGYFCGRCYQPYHHPGQHACTQNPTHCGACLQDGCSDYLDAYDHYRSATMSCRSCGRQFYGEYCLANHLTKTSAGTPCDPRHPSVCDSRRRCRQCCKVLRGGKEIRDHRCGYARCPACRDQVLVAEHRCFIQVGEEERRRGEEEEEEEDSDDDDDDEKESLHVFFDIECMQEDGRHVPNLLVAETESNVVPPRVFHGDTCISDFLEYLDTLADDCPLTVLAHNFQGYDSYPIVDEYHRQRRQLQQVRNSGKVLQLTHGKIRFIDSLSFFQMPLSAFPKTFGLTELKKGYFPHLFNTRANQAYVGPLPAKEDYLPNGMTVKGRQDFDRWYDAQVVRDVEFDFQQELVAYCKSDVKLLKEGCLTFKRDFEAQAGFNPFDQMTIASACNRDLRRNRLEANTIASEPLHGWRLDTNHSQVSMEWLLWVERRLQGPDAAAAATPPRLQHARNRGEYRIPHTRYTVDGYDATTRTVYEFHGCYWHGCPTCHPQRDEMHRRLLDRTMEDVYLATCNKTQFLRDRGYTVVEMWECAWSRAKNDDPDLRAFVDDLDLQEPLQPRQAFFGGRTNAVKLHHRADVDAGEEIRYYDYTSLYPWVNKTARYPVGHPEILYEPGTTDLTPYFGLARFTVLPPPGLYHPVLPYRTHDKLTFPLCRACVEEHIDRPLHAKVCQCHHRDDQRALTGTWCTPELQKAVDVGYVILYVHEIWHFADSRAGLFANYVNTWLKIKQEASGWPASCTTPQERQAYVDAYYAREGIQLDYDQIEHNPGRRSLAKTMNNSMWGKFGQQENKVQVVEFVEPQPFHTFLESDQHDIRYVSPLTEERVEVHFKQQQHCETLSPNLNIFVAAFTTCWARLRLYEALELLGDRVLYFDTDSVIFTYRPGQSSPPLGDYLGDFKNEIEGDDAIVEFCSGGPKNYGYCTRQGQTVCKVRGFSLNVQGAAQLNYEILRDNTLAELRRPLAAPRTTRVTQSHTIVRDSKNYALHTRAAHKDYRLVFSKRVLDPITAQTYPYGYERLSEQDLQIFNSTCVV